MFQMSKELFYQCWPLIAAQIEAGKYAENTRSKTAPTASSSTAAEAGYMLGIAIGYALKLDYPISDPVRISVRRRRTDAYGNIN